jgi:hypothetical protein
MKTVSALFCFLTLAMLTASVVMTGGNPLLAILRAGVWMGVPFLAGYLLSRKP